MKSKILPNREYPLTKENDCFNVISKGDAISIFIKSNKDKLAETNMFALYGKWGSGKTTLMNYIKSDLEKDKFKCLFFEAWKYEKDENLPLSLLHFIANQTGITGGSFKSISKLGFDVLKSSLKAVTINFELIKLDLAKAIESAEKYDEIERKRWESHYTKLEGFKNQFQAFEKEILTKYKVDNLIVFIDDLDRCEPENVLHLLSAIKLFFHFGKSTVFFFGCDKDAIGKAVQTRYGNVISGDEYLEKIIDVSFSIPINNNLYEFVRYYFVGKKDLTSKQFEVADLISEFFIAINFTNPRQLKKVLNRYEMLINFKNANLPGHLKKLIPNAVFNENDGDFFELILVLYFIVLYDFFPQAFLDLENLENKLANYASAKVRYHKSHDPNGRYTFEQSLNQIKDPQSGIMNSSLLDSSLSNLMNYSQPERKLLGRANDAVAIQYAFNSILTLFTPSRVSQFEFGINNPANFVDQFYNEKNTPEELMCLRFCNYLMKNKNSIIKSNSEFIFSSYFEMCKVLF